MTQAESKKGSLTPDQITAHQEEIKRLKLQAETGFNAESTRFLSGLGLSPVKLVVNLGCGPGFDIGPLSKVLSSDGRVIAVDNNERSLAVLPVAIEAFGLDGRVTTKLADMTEVDLDEFRGKADLVYARFSLQYVPEEKWPQLGELIRGLLRPEPGKNGLFACEEFTISTARTEPPCPAYDRLLEALQDLYQEKGWHFNMGSRLGDFSKATGLEIVSDNRESPSVIRASGNDPFKKAHEMIFVTRAEAMFEVNAITPIKFGQNMAELRNHLYDPATIAVTPAVVQGTMR